MHCPHCGGDISVLAPLFHGQGPALKNTADLPAAPPYGGKTEPPSATPGDVVLQDAVYNRGFQDVCWRKTVEREGLVGGLSVGDIVDRAVVTAKPPRSDGSITIHLLFKKAVTPVGGLIHRQLMRVGPHADHGGEAFDATKLRTMGYSIVPGENGIERIQTVNDHPVGPIWNILMYWAGGAQHKRWHMPQPIRLSAARNGCPDFMDDRMVGLTAWFTDYARLGESLQLLATYCSDGIQTATGTIPPAAPITSILIA